jgi:hypothetical protein
MSIEEQRNVTLGVPRLREIINVAKKIKIPSLFVYLKPEVNKTKERERSVQYALEYTMLQSVTDATKVWYDPDPMRYSQKNEKLMKRTLTTNNKRLLSKDHGLRSYKTTTLISDLLLFEQKYEHEKDLNVKKLAMIVWALNHITI